MREALTARDRSKKQLHEADGSSLKRALVRLMSTPPFYLLYVQKKLTSCIIHCISPGSRLIKTEILLEQI